MISYRICDRLPTTMAGTKLTAQIKQQIAANNTVEIGKSTSSNFPKEFGKQLKQNLASTPDDSMSQLLGIGRFEETTSSISQEMKPGQEFVLPKKTSQKELPTPERRPHIAAGIDYHAEVVRHRERGSKRESQEIQYQIQQIMEELQRLVSSSDKIIQMTYGQVTVSTTPTIVGKYHTNFFTWMLTVIRTARQKVEDSGAWLATAKGKGGKKGYWNQFKKHGTSFGMSNERQVATQTG